ncbi:hypothetical protein [Pseudonocardia charpentierae]|uniref:Uncharacterized protein n=1 Tax=Pseudonocardia charpentierae TaxID=3075545 RepID=A0ABU2ND12_9PSEU|nr:hypothetical protein [Pseudonocardia sp. DSM 45834]MDT0351625.1 hypothetical protein [Pseudonocardia sp. DSM 45834]
MYEINFSFEHGAGVFLWCSNPDDEQRWGGNPVDPATLPISADLRAELTRLGEWYNTSLNWAYPPDPGPWRQQECDRFNTAATTALDRLRTELCAEWEVIRNFADQYEDADLDRYLADPAGFQRRPSPPPTATTTP